MSFEEFKVFSQKDIQFLKKLESHSSKPSTRTFNFERRKIIETMSICKICGTETVQYFQMLQKKPGTWSKELEVKQHEVNNKLPHEAIKVSVRSCWNCLTTLMEKPKDELAKMLLEFMSPKPVVQKSKEERKIEAAKSREQFRNSAKRRRSGNAEIDD